VRRRPPGRPASILRAAALLGLAVPAGLAAQRPALLDGAPPPTTLLYQNFPNPFPAAGQDSTCIWFDLAETGSVELEILDLRGGPVRRFIPGRDFGEVLSGGRYGRGVPGGPPCDPRLMWDGRADDGRVVPAGVYLYKLTAGGVIQFRRIVFRGRNR